MLMYAYMRRLFRLFVPILVVAHSGLQAQNCVLICKQNLQVSLDPSGVALVTTGLVVPSAATYCPGQLDVELFSSQGEAIPNPVTCDWTNQLITAEITHPATGNTCFGTLLVRDLLPPQVQCPEIWAACPEDTSPQALGYPAATDNCTPSDALMYVFSDNFTSLPCGSQNNGIGVAGRIQRYWTVHDEHGNSSFCMQDIWIQSADLSTVTFPPSLDGFALPALNCGADPNDPGLTGQPLISGQPIAANGPCDIAVTHNDQTIDVCPPAGTTVLRTWTVADFCNSAVVTHLQVIHIVDQTPPQIAQPLDVTVGTNPFSCEGTLILEMPPATDDCSAVQVSAQWQFGSGQGPFTAPLGEHVVTYMATDACGNTASATGRVVVVDTDPPQVVCTNSLQVSLTGSGTALVTPAMLDEGSIDGCGAVAFSVSRDGENWLPQMVVTCNDIGQPIPVTLRVTDGAGLENFCTVDVQVRDLLRPQLSCPPGTTINCLQNYQDLTLCGNATSSDNCFLQIFEYEDAVNLDACHSGSVARTWHAIDASGNSRVCTQLIVVQTVGGLTVQFPAQMQVNTCWDSVSFSPTTTGMPQFSGLSCLPPSVTYADAMFNAPAPYCFRILRTWTATDWCVFDINTGFGRWEHTQIIDVRDQQAPELTIPPDVTVSANQPGCAASISLAPASAADCSPNVPITNNSAFAASAGADASGVYAEGIHEVVFTATDGCGNTVQGTLLITVLNNPVFCGTQVCSVGGQVRTPTGLPVVSAAIHLQATGGLLLTTTTDTNGNYQFYNVPAGSDYVLVPAYDSLWINGLSTYDLVLINKHILGIDTFGSPYKMIAADANKSWSVTTFDIAQLRKLILGIQTSLSGNQSWRFVDAAYQFPNPTNAFFENFPEQILLPALSNNRQGLDFIGVKTGDVNDSN